MPNVSAPFAGFMQRKFALLATAMLFALISVQTEAKSQTYPDRTVTLVVPFAAGGGADATGRIITDAMAKHFGQSIVVENVTGAGGAIGSTRVKNATPDGYTIGLGSLGTLAASVAINPKLKFDSRRDFEYLGLVNTTPNIVFVRKDFPANTLSEFIDYAKAKGRDLKMGHSGIGATSHITCVLLFQLIGAQPTYVTYRGYGQTINDILSGSIDGSCDLVTSVSGQISAGAVKAFAIAADERSPALPAVPTAKEAGLPEFRVETWMGLFAPKGTPAPVLARLKDALEKSLIEPAVQKRFAEIGAAVPKPDRQGGEYMLKLVGSEVDRWSGILKKAGVEPPQ
jgi:tripartite-type tricarboxylate transporter receptor subunit TctC